VLVLLPELLHSSSRRVTGLAGMLPASAWERLAYLGAGGVAGGGPALSVTQAWLVLLAWPVVAAVLAATVVRRRDV
jgi:ABC-2 type transport system permease protein